MDSVDEIQNEDELDDEIAIETVEEARKDNKQQIR